MFKGLEVSFKCPLKRVKKRTFNTIFRVYVSYIHVQLSFYAVLSEVSFDYLDRRVNFNIISCHGIRATQSNVWTGMANCFALMLAFLLVK